MTDTMVLPLSSRARVALALARGIAAARGDENVSPAHIAIGVLREGENAAVATLLRAGVDLRALRSALESTLGPEGRPRSGEVSLPMTPGEYLVRARAAAESERQRDPVLAPHHLLLALLHDASTPVARVFARHGIEYAAMIDHLRIVLEGTRGDGGPPTVPPAA